MKAEQAVGDHRRNAGRDDDLGFELRITVKDLRSEERSGQRGPEDAAHPGADTRRHHDPSLAIRQLKFGGQKRSETGADLSDRSLSAAGSTGGQGQGRGNRLDNGDATADKTAFVVVSVYGGIGPVSLGFGGKGVDDPPAQDSAQRGQEQEHPPIEGCGGGRQQVVLSGRSRRPVPGQEVQEIVETDLGQIMEYDRPQTGDDADQNKIEGPFTGIGKIERPPLFDQCLKAMCWSSRQGHAVS